jgi:hypothetical protein
VIQKLVLIAAGFSYIVALGSAGVAAFALDKVEKIQHQVDLSNAALGVEFSCKSLTEHVLYCRRVDGKPVAKRQPKIK